MLFFVSSIEQIYKILGAKGNKVSQQCGFYAYNSLGGHHKVLQAYSTNLYIYSIVLIKVLTMHHSMPRKIHKILCLREEYILYTALILEVGKTTNTLDNERSRLHEAYKFSLFVEIKWLCELALSLVGSVLIIQKDIDR